MRGFLWSLIAVTALGAGCGRSAKDICEKVMQKSIECMPESSSQLGDLGNAKDFMSGMIGEVCSEDELAKAMLGAKDCLDAKDCAAFNECVRKASPGPLGGLGGVAP